MEVTPKHTDIWRSECLGMPFIVDRVFYAQSKALDGAPTINEIVQNNVVCTEEGTTCFTEVTSMVSRVERDMVDTHLQNYVETISQFLSRPVLLSTVSYSVSSPVLSSLYSNLSIGDLLDATTVWTDKLSGYGLMKGTFVLRVEINASPFQQGSLLLHYVPCYRMFQNQPAKFNKTLVQRLQHPHLIVSAQDTSAEIEIPFVTPEDYYRLQGKATNYADWGAVFLDVLTPLRVGTTATQTSCTLQIYGFWKDLSLSAPMIAQMSGKVVRAKGRSNTELNADNKVSTTLMSISTGLSSVSNVPVIGSYATPLSWIARAGSAVASAFGYSKPPVDVTPSVMVNQPGRYIGLSDGPDVSIGFGVDHDNKLMVDASRSMDGRDEMSYSYLLQQIPNYKGTYEWTSSNMPNTVLFQHHIGPVDMHGAEHVISGTAHTTSIRYGGPMYYLGNVHELYRGSVKVHVRIVKTQYHSGKLLVVYTPNVTGTMVTPTTTNSTLAIRQIIDIRELSEFTLTLPYMASSEYLSVTNEDGYSETHMGFLTVMVLNQLRNPDTVSNSVDMLVSYTAGDDFEFAMPCAPHYGRDLLNSIPWGLPVIEDMAAQSSTTIVAAGIGDTAEKTRDLISSGKCTGETVNSVKQLVNRYSFSNSTISTHVNPEVFPWYISVYRVDVPTGTVHVPSPSVDAYSYFANMYLFSRGSMRLLFAPYVVLSNSTLIFGSLSTSSDSVGDISYVRAAQGTPGGYQQSFTIYTDFRNQMVNSVACNTLTDGLAHFRVPYQSRYPVSIINPSAGTTAVRTGYEPKTRMILNRALGASPTGSGLGRSVGDDFQFLYFINCPGLVWSSVAE